MGRVDRYFRKVGVAALELDGDLSVGDRIKIVGATTDFEIVVESIQIELESVGHAGAGDDVGIKVPERVRPSDRVIRIG
ncbi:MAG: translation elongation factor-like protein [Euryarchaeota archaeon]|nr:translation elongation factor-like protein [Euryarchaeota archaeon]